MDQDRKFTGSIDAVFEAKARIVRTSVPVPEANAIAQRSSETVRAESLNKMLIVDAPNLERTLAVIVDHYNGHRPHRSLDLAPELLVVIKRNR